MTRRTESNAIARLHDVAIEIVAKTRQVFASQGQDARELRLPILMHGTDMRVTIESGPRIAARNAIEHAQMQAGGEPETSAPMGHALREAQSLLGMYADTLAQQQRAAAPGSVEWRSAKDCAQRCADTARALHDVERLL